MSDLPPPSLFLDAALIVAALSADNADSPSRRLFKMGEVGLVRLVTSERITGEVQSVLQALTGEEYGAVKVLLAESLVLANVVIAAQPEPGCEVFATGEEPSLRVTSEREPLGDQIIVMTAAEALEWAVAKVQIRARLSLEAKRTKR